ncbi:hypothetical protein [Pedococcus sp. 5OH_020]|uniref:hypothetical protein n=1 Tax=Pedococcus sp. 5OH_020 TaxID=2989814 RepID=UPI0022E9AB4C|nr:hypothetical protein [Pedococcus sp. 5OH_020]
MSVPWQSAGESRGLLLVHGEPRRVSSWVRGGLVACDVVERGPWTVLLPAEPFSRAAPPYDDALGVLVSRPVPRRLRPALGFLVVDDRALVTVQPGGWAVRRRWVAWEPGTGVVRVPGWDLASPRALATAAAGAGAPGLAAAVAAVLADRTGDAQWMMDRLLGALRLPGAGLLSHGEEILGTVVRPSARAVARFDARMTDQARHRAELEEG